MSVITNDCIDCGEILHIMKLSRSTQQSCIKCFYCCPDYGSRTCPRCETEFEKYWWDNKEKLEEELEVEGEEQKEEQKKEQHKEEEDQNYTFSVDLNKYPTHVRQLNGKAFASVDEYTMFLQQFA